LTAVFTGAAEGLLDGVVLRRLVNSLGYEIPTVFGETGVANLLNALDGYNKAAEYSPWAVVFDLDQTECAPALLADVLPVRSRYMCCRVAVREIESWLMGDSERLASFLSVPQSAVSGSPDELADPKEAMVNLARRSRKRAIRAQMVPAAGAGATGPAYTATLIEFTTSEFGWRPEVARVASESLDRAIRCIEASAALWSQDTD
jgi:hypothetical protein